jgi:lactaldehyde dehydrogenase/glycolaldehyde dehydrogenase
MVSLTGSVEGGVAIMHAAADNVTKVSLELGGKAPAIVMADADLELAVKAIHASRIINTGQVCNCAERVYVHESIAAEFIDRMTVAMDKTVVGDPFDAGVEMGPLVSETQLELVEAAVLKAVADGSQLMTGGKRYPGRAGWYYRRRCSRTAGRRQTSCRRRFSARFCPSRPSATWTRRSSSPTIASTASPRRSTPTTLTW